MQAAPEPQTVLGFDYGSRKIGVAVGQTLTATASPITVVANTKDGPDWQVFEQLVNEWRPARLIVGLPLSLDGGEQPMSRAARRFAEELSARFRLPVDFSDERGTTKAARSDFAERRAAGLARRSAGRQVDALAAQLIVEQWLNR